MAKFLNKTANEGGAFLLNIIFRDENKNVVSAKTQEWQLMKLDRSIVNNRSFANSVLGGFTGNRVVLTGDDLAIFGDDDTRFRIFAVKGTYDSTFGNDLPCVTEVEFVITRMLNVPDSGV